MRSLLGEEIIDVQCVLVFFEQHKLSVADAKQKMIEIIVVACGERIGHIRLGLHGDPVVLAGGAENIDMNSANRAREARQRRQASTYLICLHDKARRDGRR
jgi:hypothetical protein